jgi:hypothetical protein
MRLIVLVAAGALSGLGGACEKKASDTGEVSVTTHGTPSRSLPRTEILHIAQEDARKAYRDLSSMEVKAELEGDGWHVEYEPRGDVNGGGPHYLIHPETGQILKKMYYQ